MLYLVQRHHIDILQINLVQIADIYLRYLSKVDVSQITSDYLYIAARLAYLKSRAILGLDPEKDENQTNEKDIIHSLILYKKIKEISISLKTRQFLGKSVFFARAKFERPKQLKEREAIEIVKIYSKIIEKKDGSSPVYSFDLSKNYNVSDFAKKIKRFISLHKTITLSRLFLNTKKIEKICYFLAILELAKNGIIMLLQDKVERDIVISKR